MEIIRSTEVSITVTTYMVPVLLPVQLKWFKEDDSEIKFRNENIPYSVEVRKEAIIAIYFFKTPKIKAVLICLYQS